MSGAKSGYKPSLGQYRIYNLTFGYLTVAPGFCGRGTCHVFAAINDEFGCGSSFCRNIAVLPPAEGMQ